MSIFCIPKNLVAKLRDSALKGEVDIKKLYDMSSSERRDFFSKYTDENIGKLLNTEFEKAMISKQQTALTDWAKSVFSPKEKAKPVYKSILDKINNLEKEGILTPKTEGAFLEDLVSDKLGVNVSPAEIKIIGEKAKIVQDAQELVGEDLGNPAKEKEITNFLSAKKDIDDYLQSINPANNLKVLTGTVGRGMMLASVKSPLLNIGSNTLIGASEAIVRRISTGRITGADNVIAMDYIKMVNRVYQKTGYDLSRMMSLGDQGVSGGRVLGETVHSQGPGAVRTVGRFFDDVVFKQLMGAPDVAFSSAAFADSLNLESMKLTKGNKVKASAAMRDAMKIKPQTPEGEILREQAILDAQTSTWTGRTWASNATDGARKVINSVSGDARAGDYLMPFVITPSNVLATGADYAGVGALKGVYEVVNTIRKGEVIEPKNMSNITRNIVRSGLGITAAVIIAYNLKDEDFVGAYDPSRAQIEQLRGSNYNAIKIGNKWVSIDWLGPIGTGVLSIMFARKYGDTIPEKVFQYGKSVVGSFQNLPGVSDIADVFNTTYKKNQTLEDMTGETSNYIAEQLASRLTPSIMSDVAKTIDSKNRETAGTTLKIIPNTVINKIPGVRQTLPEKKNIFGETIMGEPAWSDILFGSRVKTGTETALIKEISDVSTALDKPITFTNWDKSSSQTLAQFKKEKGQEIFDKAKIEYGQTMKTKLEKIISSPEYKKLSDEDKLRLINNVDSQVTDDLYKKYGFKYKAQQKTKLPKF